MLPKKIADLSFNELSNICNNPAAYDLTIQEMFDVVYESRKVTDAYYFNENKKLKKQLDEALKKNAKLRSIVEASHKKIDYTVDSDGDS